MRHHNCAAPLMFKKIIFLSHRRNTPSASPEKFIDSLKAPLRGRIEKKNYHHTSMMV